jgi:hypothetical protein
VVAPRSSEASSAGIGLVFPAYSSGTADLWRAIIPLLAPMRIPMPIPLAGALVASACAVGPGVVAGAHPAKASNKADPTNHPTKLIRFIESPRMDRMFNRYCSKLRVSVLYESHAKREEREGNHLPPRSFA